MKVVKVSKIIRDLLNDGWYLRTMTEPATDNSRTPRKKER